MTNKIIVASFGDGDASRGAVALGVKHTEVRGATSVVRGLHRLVAGNDHARLWRGSPAGSRQHHGRSSA